MNAAEMVGDRVGEYPGSGIVAFIAIALFFYVLLKPGRKR